MKYGVVYKFKQQNKINGSLFYCFEYFKFLRKFVDIKFYIVDINPKDLQLVYTIFKQKYNTNVDNVIPIKLVDLYKVKLDRSVVLDIKTFYDCKEFLTGDVFCYSNEAHPMFRYKNHRTVTYYGSYDYQNYDVFSYLKLNFEIFKSFGSDSGVFVSSLDQEYIKKNVEKYKQQFQKPVILKKSYTGNGNLFDMIDCVHYVHVRQDTNNRIIPEAFFYKKEVSIEETALYNGIDSIQLRYKDILSNGLSNYTLSDKDEIVQACLK
jgi:hypothetical protein